MKWIFIAALLLTACASNSDLSESIMEKVEAGNTDFSGSETKYLQSLYAKADSNKELTDEEQLLLQKIRILRLSEDWSGLADRCRITGFSCNDWQVKKDGTMSLMIVPEADYSNIQVEACGQTKEYAEQLIFENCDVSVSNLDKTSIEIKVSYTDGGAQMSAYGMLNSAVN